MSGLEQRLRDLEGVADITVELGEEGLEEIKITVTEESDEAAVLDEVRRLLITYGLKSRRDTPQNRLLPEFAPQPAEPGASSGTAPASKAKIDGTHGVAASSSDASSVESLTDELNQGDGPSDVSIIKTTVGIQVRLRGMGRELIEDGPATAEGAARAMVVALSRWRGLEPPERVGVKIDEIEGEQIITITVGTGNRVGAGAGVGRPSLGNGLYRAAESALTSRPDPDR